LTIPLIWRLRFGVRRERRLDSNAIAGGFSAARSIQTCQPDLFGLRGRRQMQSINPYFGQDKGAVGIVTCACPVDVSLEKDGFKRQFIQTCKPILNGFSAIKGAH
jgi:hypothetical protein